MEFNNHQKYNKELKPLSIALRNDMTKAEACLWKYALRAKMMKGYSFKRQRLVLNYIADFMCPELNLIIEADGMTHNFSDVQIKDEKKQRALEENGFTVLRFTDNEILNNIDGVFQHIWNWIEEREKQVPPPTPSRGGHASNNKQ
jgi:very-short-patch-repair endonuclease